MITDEEYHAMMRRVNELSVLDPEPDSDLGKELLALADVLEEYERVKFPIESLIVDMRGGMPDKCSFCGKVTHKLEPWEAGDWACSECADKEYEDARQEQYDNSR